MPGKPIRFVKEIGLYAFSRGRPTCRWKTRWCKVNCGFILACSALAYIIWGGTGGNMRECWKFIGGLGRSYEVSNLGRVRRVRDGHLVPQSYAGRGYLRVALTFRGRGLFRYVHRLVAKAFVPNPDGKPEVNHDDGDKEHNRVGNLLWATHSENHLHRVHVLGQSIAHLQRAGEAHPRARLTEEDVRCILKRLAAGEPQVQIAADYAITQVAVSHIKLGKTWQHIKRS